VLAVLRRWTWLAAVFRQPRLLAAFALSALLLSTNWLVYVWSVQNHHVLDASLGYFILPLVNVALGFFILRERPRRGQWLAVAVAASGVLWLAIQAGHPPWIALALAFSFGFYGLLRKVASLGALEGLTLETLLLAPVAALVLGFSPGRAAARWRLATPAPGSGWHWAGRSRRCRSCCSPQVRAAFR
jgi:chloramphenicol-sensitive protein RarD